MGYIAGSMLTRSLDPLSSAGSSWLLKALEASQQSRSDALLDRNTSEAEVKLLIWPKAGDTTDLGVQLRVTEPAGKRPTVREEPKVSARKGKACTSADRSPLQPRALVSQVHAKGSSYPVNLMLKPTIQEFCICQFLWIPLQCSFQSLRSGCPDSPLLPIYA